MECLVNTQRNKLDIIYDDINFIEETVVSFDEYKFTKNIINLMDKICISSNELAKRCNVSHVIVSKWRQGQAKPKGKERMKVLGMALEMDFHELNNFLFNNCYPKLYVKNPLDSACEVVLRTGLRGKAAVDYYRKFVEQYKLEEFCPTPKYENYQTSAVYRSFNSAINKDDYSGWIDKYSSYFGEDSKSLIANSKLLTFISLYIDSPVNDLYVAGKLSTTLKNMLYELYSKKGVRSKTLRTKLIYFGFYCNMLSRKLISC